MDIIQRTPAYTNEMMWQYCETLKTIVSKTKDVKIGRGKNIETIYLPKYNNSKESIDKITRSCEYYKNLCEMEPKVKFRDYQSDIINKGLKIIKEHGFLYLAMEVRTGKTLTSLGIADRLGVRNVLFITKKKAISSIEQDYKLLEPSFKLTVINYESLHHVVNSFDWDMVICDEAHSMGAFPKPSQRALEVYKLVRKLNLYVVLLSGTPTPESYSQMYHQVYGIVGNPFAEFKNFYRFCDVHVKVRERKMNGLTIRDYSKGLDSIIEKMAPYTINYSQEQAGFASKTDEEIIEVEMKPSTYNLINRLKRDLVVEGKEETILCDTPVKLMMKLHQLYSGTIKFESGNSMVVDNSKAQFIFDNFYSKKIGIFYKFKEELEALKSVYGDQLTTELSMFKQTDKSIALQIVSGREGISLKEAEFLVYYNIDFSATSYWQSKDRMTTKDRLENKVYWIFAKDGIEYDIYKAVTKKKDYTLKHFEKTLN